MSICEVGVRLSVRFVCVCDIGACLSVKSVCVFCEVAVSVLVTAVYVCL